MTDYTWIGNSGSDTLASTAGNWSPNGVPGTNDTCIFDSKAENNCTFDISQVTMIKCEMPPASGSTDELGVDYGYYRAAQGFVRVINFTTNVTCAAIYFNGAFTSFNTSAPYAAAAREITVTGTLTIGGSNLRPISFGSLATFVNPETGTDYRDNFTFKFVAPSSTTVCLEDGIYPHVELSGSGTWGFGHNSEVNNRKSGFSSVDMNNLTVAATTSKMSTSSVINDRKKKYIVNGNIAISSNSFNTGYTTWVLTPTSGGRRIPTTGDTANFGGGTTFTAQWHNLTIQRGASDGNFAYMEDGLTLLCDSLTVDAGALLKPENNTKGNAIKTNSKPHISGSWDFYDVGAGLYHSDPTNAVFMSPKAGSAGQVLTIVKGVPDWGTVSADVAAESTIDVGTLTVTGISSTVVFGDLTL